MTVSREPPVLHTSGLRLKAPYARNPHPLGGGHPSPSVNLPIGKAPCPHYTDPQSTVLPNLDRLCYKIGFMTGHRAHGVWQQVVRLPTWTHP